MIIVIIIIIIITIIFFFFGGGGHVRALLTQNFSTVNCSRRVRSLSKISTRLGFNITLSALSDGYLEYSKF